ncbi:hypothetical protein PCASD_26318, partial [Puccinia coronata f. sp. avenae]
MDSGSRGGSTALVFSIATIQDVDGRGHLLLARTTCQLGSRMANSTSLRNSQSPVVSTAGINRSNTAVRAVLEQPCSTGGRTGTVRPKHLPAGRTGLSDQFLGPIAQDQPGPVGQICPTSWLSLRSDSVRPTTGRTRLFKHRSSSRVRPVNAGSAEAKKPDKLAKEKLKTAVSKNPKEGAFSLK